MRKKPLKARKRAKVAMGLRGEAAEMLGMPLKGVERLTQELAPLAREGGGTEGDVLVLLHRIAHHRRQRPGDFDYILGSTFRAVDDLTLEGLHGLPLKAMVKDAAPIIRVCMAICEILWPDEWASHQSQVERRNLQMDHARLSATGMLLAEMEELEAVRGRMQELDVEPDPELEAQARRERDEAGLVAPPWENG